MLNCGIGRGTSHKRSVPPFASPSSPAPSQATPALGQCPWRSAPTGGCWPPAPMTTRSSCGKWPQAEKCAPSPATPTMSIPWRSAPTGGSWPPAPMTRRSSCGMWPVAASCAPSPATPALSGSVAFSPDGRLLASGSCGQRDSGGNCMSRMTEFKLWDVSHRSEACAPSPRPHRLGQVRGVQPRRAAVGLRLLRPTRQRRQLHSR
jgi:hypothetical protein